MKQTVIDIALEQIYQAIVKSKNPDALTKRTGEYRIGLRKAMEILSNLKEIEKERMFEVYHGYQDYLNNEFKNQCGGQSVILTFEEYYNETFNTNEK